MKILGKLPADYGRPTDRFVCRKSRNMTGLIEKLIERRVGRCNSCPGASVLKIHLPRYLSCTSAEINDNGRKSRQDITLYGVSHFMYSHRRIIPYYTMLEIRIILLSIDLKHLRQPRSLYEKLHIGKIPRLIAEPFFPSTIS